MDRNKSRLMVVCVITMIAGLYFMAVGVLRTHSWTEIVVGGVLILGGAFVGMASDL